MYIRCHTSVKYIHSNIQVKYLISIPRIPHKLFNEEFEGTKGVIRISKSKDRQHNGQKIKEKGTDNDLQNSSQKTIDRVTRTPLKPEVNSGVAEGRAIPSPLVTPSF
jgi:hypothetical protein